jgi:hypothetical protein
MPYAPKPKAKPKKIKVSQSTIDKIKKRGMTASLKKAQSSTNAEYQEAIKRMYGARRASAAKAQGADARLRKSVMPNFSAPKKPKPKGGGGMMGMM